MKTILALIAIATGALAQPSVTAVLDAGAYTNNIAPGSVFVVKGAGLSAAGYVAAAAPAYPTVLNNAKITLTAVSGGGVVPALMVYTYNQSGVNQLAAVIPSTAVAGAYDLRVDNSGVASAPFRTNVLARKPGIVTATSDGQGPAQATLGGLLILQRTANVGKVGIFDTRSAHPGERVDLWGTGLGADTASDSGGTSGDQTAAGQIRVVVGGVDVTPLYAGRSQGFPGLDQIVFNLPTAVALNCSVDIQVRAGGVLSNNVTISTSTSDACPAGPPFRINEVESNGGVPGDWVELYNPTSTAASLNGYIFKDNDDTHNYPLPNVTIPAGGYYLLEEADFGFGLGAGDAARIFRLDGTLADSYIWTAHAATTYARCPNGFGPFVTATSSTKGAANDCGSPVKINEVESDAGVPGDWVELYNSGATTADVSGFLFRDNDDTHNYLLPQGATIAAGGYLVLDEAAFGFGLGSADSARLYDASGALIDSYSWTSHAATTYGRCPNGSGAFVTTTVSTKGAANACPAELTYLAWPGSAAIQTVDVAGTFASNLSGLAYEASGSATPGILWGADNGPGSLYRLIFNGTNWVPDTANNWSGGKALRYPNGTGDPDSEGITFVGPNAATGGIYISAERNNSNNTVSRNSILRFDPTAVGVTLTATHEWNLTADLPATGANLGLEAITWVPDAYLTSKSFFDENKNRAYNPADYANHGAGLFFVGLEANGQVYAYALDHGAGTFTRIATIVTGLPAVMDLQFDRDLNDLWAVCDDTCQGRTVVLRPDSTGKFTVARRFERPSGMPNINNEGFAIAPAALCVNNLKPVYWSDDSSTGGNALRSGTLPCTVQ